MLAVGCKRDLPVDGSSGGERARDAAAAAPAEHLAPGELVEGKEKAFGLVLPRDVIVEKRYDDVVWARSDVQPLPIADFFKKRVTVGKVSTSLEEATLDQVDVPGMPGQKLYIHITYSQAHVQSRIEIRNVTPPSLDGLPDEAARWRAAGMTPDGKPLDPKHLH